MVIFRGKKIMKLGTKEHDDIFKNFEKNFSHLRLDKEKNPELRRKGSIYESGETNKLYQAFILGYSFGRVNYLN